MNTRPIERYKNYANSIYTAAKKKGLVIQRNSIGVGWCVSLPMGNCYTAKTLEDLRSFVRGY